MKEPKETKCSVCYDSKYGDENGLGVITKQYCLDNPKHPTYKERYDIWDGLTYLDCWSFIRQNETEEEWKKRVFKRKNIYKKKEEPYQSDFSKWVQSTKKDDKK